MSCVVGLGAGRPVKPVGTEARMIRLAEADPFGLNPRPNGGAEIATTDHVNMAAAAMMRCMLMPFMRRLFARSVL